MREYDSEFLLKILNKSSIETKNNSDKELFIDENWKIHTKNISNITPYDNANFIRILSEIFIDKKYWFRIIMISRKQFPILVYLILKAYFSYSFNIYFF